MKFIHFTDTHLVPRGEILHGLNPCERLDACIDDINRNHADAELCVLTGDLAHVAQPKAYEDLNASLAKLRVPIHLLVGNHDKRESLLAEFPDIPKDSDGFLQTTVDTSAGRFVILDTVEQGKGWGSYCDARLAWLRDALDRSREKAVYLFMHHPPFDVGIPCIDRIGLGADGDRIGDVLADFDNVRHIFFGHVHRPIAGSWHGIPYTTLRATSHQTPLDFDITEVVPKSHEPPAYAVVFLTEHQTTVHFHDFLDTYRVPYERKSEGRPDWKPA